MQVLVKELDPHLQNHQSFSFGEDSLGYDGLFTPEGSNKLFAITADEEATKKALELNGATSYETLLAKMKDSPTPSVDADWALNYILFELAKTQK